MARPDAADGDSGGVEWTEPLTIETVGRVPTVAPPGKKSEVVGVLNTAALNWEPEGTDDPSEKIPSYEIFALAAMAGVKQTSAERWFGMPGPNNAPRAPRNAVPLKIIGRPKRGFLPPEKRRRMCTIDQSEYSADDPRYTKDKAARKLDLLRTLFAACACATNGAPDLSSGSRYLPGIYDRGAGGIYRSEPVFGTRDARGRWRVYEYDPAFCATAADAAKRVRLYTDPESGLAIDSGHTVACAWVRIWIERSGNERLPWVVRCRHTYPSKNQTYALEAFDVNEDSEENGGGFDIQGAAA